MSFSSGEGEQFSFSFSHLDNPFINLAWEDFLLKGNFTKKSHLFLYRNQKCVVAGRFQVPWREMNFKYPDPIVYVRRRSGGGTVYHDLGNWNFCFIHRGRELQRKENLERVISVAQSMGVHLEMNERFDLIYPFEQKNFKVSGSAFKQKKDFALHHGTLLVDAGLGQLKGVLGVTEGWKVIGKGIASVPSPVKNIESLTYSQWLDAWMGLLNIKKDHLKPVTLSEEVRQEARLLSQWSWRFGETPSHEVTFEGKTDESLSLKIEKGVVTDQRGLQGLIDFVGLKVCSLTELELKKVLGPLYQSENLSSSLESNLSALLKERKSHFVEEF